MGDRTGSRTRWYAVRVWPAGFLLASAVLAVIARDWPTALLTAVTATVLLLGTQMQALAHRSGYYRGKAETLEALGRAHSPDELARLLAVEHPDPWAPQ